MSSLSRTVRVPRQLLKEFQQYVVCHDGRTEAEIIRSLMAEAIRKAKELLQKSKSDGPVTAK